MTEELSGHPGFEVPAGVAEWHAGEIALQHSTGVANKLAPHARRVLLPYLTDQLRTFFPLLPFVVISYLDAHKRPWGTLLAGAPGFVWSPAPTLLRVERTPPRGDPFMEALSEGTSIGLLGIELPTRRRNRVNGVVSRCDASGFTITVHQAYGNCPRYIQQRACAPAGELPSAVSGAVFSGLEDMEARELIAQADTMFVASHAPGPGGASAMDVSHRGGKPGFIRLDAGGTLTIPDFSGNHYFNTLGNILLTGSAGIVVPAFETGDLLLLSGDATVGMDAASHAEAAQIGGERLWRLFPGQGRWLRGALPLAFRLTPCPPQMPGRESQ